MEATDCCWVFADRSEVAWPLHLTHGGFSSVVVDAVFSFLLKTIFFTSHGHVLILGLFVLMTLPFSHRPAQVRCVTFMC